MLDLKGKIALVTGASGSIGSSIVKVFHSLGAKIVASGSNESKLVNLASNFPKNFEFKVANLKNKEEVLNLAKELDHVDILVCNAGITKDNLSVRMSDADFEDVINVNLVSNFILSREILKKMIRNDYGRIISISSVVGFTGNPGQANYCASKAGIVGMTKSLAHEVAKRNITVNAVAPGFISSEMTDKLNEEQKKAIFGRIPAQRFGKPEDVANVCAFLASDASSYINGQTLHVNGGMFMN